MLLSVAIDTVLEQGGFDPSSSNSSRSAVAGWIDPLHKEMVRKARYRRESVTIASTVAGQAAYVLPANVVQVDAVTVGGTPYTRKGRRQLARLLGGPERILYGFVSGFFVPTFDASGNPSVTLYPSPTNTGDAIVGDCAVAADTLSTADETQPLLVDDEFAQGIIDGAIGTGRRRVDLRPDLAVPFEQQFDTKVEEARRFIAGRVGGSGPSQLRVLR